MSATLFILKLTPVILGNIVEMICTLPLPVLVFILIYSSCYKDPGYPDDYVFEAKLLPNVTMPARTLRPQGVLGPYRPQIGFSQRGDPTRSYSAPASVQRMIRL